jgi:hypothetical protein
MVDYGFVWMRLVTSILIDCSGISCCGTLISGPLGERTELVEVNKTRTAELVSAKEGITLLQAFCSELHLDDEAAVR